MAEATIPQVKNNLEGEQFISLKSYRKNGNAVSTPVWFTEKDGKIYVVTMATAWKIKRIRNNPEIEITPCDARGETHGEAIKAVASLHEYGSPTEKMAHQLLLEKYGWMKRLFDLMWWMRGTKITAIEITI